MKLELSKGAKDLLSHYFSIQVGEWKITCPYFMNVTKSKNLSVVWSGKGLPEEIEFEAAKIFSSRNGHNKNAQDAKDFLILCGLGIDCSGLVVNVLNAHLEETIGKSIYSLIRHPSLFHRLLFLLRPREHVWAGMLTGNLNAKEVELKNIKPGDLFRQGTKHVVLVEWVESQNGVVTKVGYVESNTRPEWGVQRGEIKIKNINKGLEDQEWSVDMAKKRYISSQDHAIVALKWLSN